MAHGIRIGIIGAGGPAIRHAEGYKAAGGFSLAAVADLIPARRKNLAEQFGVSRQVAEAQELIGDVGVDAVSICLPNALHLPIALAALKAGKHVLCEIPPVLTSGEARKLSAAAARAGKVLLFAFQRRFGGAEQAARLAIEKGYIGQPWHVRASWMRTRGVPAGTGWYTDRALSGGGAMLDLGIQMIDLAWNMLGEPAPLSAYAVFHHANGATPPDIEDAGMALLRFEGGKSLELSASWAIDQPPRDNGTRCQIYAERGAILVYNPQGPLLYRNFNAAGDAKETPLKMPKTVHYPAMMRHFKECITQNARPRIGGAQSIVLMQIIEAIAKSASTGKSVAVAAASLGADTAGSQRRQDHREESGDVAAENQVASTIEQ